MNRAIKYAGESMPEELVEYRATVKAPGSGPDTPDVGKVSVSRFGYDIAWINMQHDRVTVEEPGLEKAVAEMKAYLARSGNLVADEVYTGIEVTDETIEKFTERVIGVQERKNLLIRFYRLMADVTGQSWYVLSGKPFSAWSISIQDIEGIDTSAPEPLFYLADAAIMVPTALRFPYNVSLGEKCRVMVKEYVPIETKASPGESDIECINRLAAAIVKSYGEASSKVDGLISERDRKLEATRSRIRATVELAMRSLAARGTINTEISLLYELCGLYRPAESLPVTLSRFAAMAAVLCNPETTGVYEGGVLTFDVDREHLSAYRDAFVTAADLFEEGDKTFLNDIDPERPTIHLKLEADAAHIGLEMYGSGDPANSPHVE